jgi:hypothetical protein
VADALFAFDFDMAVYLIGINYEDYLTRIAGQS